MDNRFLCSCYLFLYIVIFNSYTEYERVYGNLTPNGSESEAGGKIGH